MNLYVLEIIEGISYFNSFSPMLITFTIKDGIRNLSISFGSSSFTSITPSLYNLSISEKHSNWLSELESAAIKAGIKLCNSALKAPEENVFCLISSKSSSLGTYIGLGFSTRLSALGSVQWCKNRWVHELQQSTQKFGLSWRWKIIWQHDFRKHLTCLEVVLYDNV